ncbi:MAG TPA: type II CAAX endopeptidase family protein [Terriglobales bacterium]|nr:type II CAAX endopeptidase family protein [Terriglobales bacterium]
MKNIFFGARGLRSGWRLLLFVGIFVALGFLANWMVHRIPTLSALTQLPFLHPFGLIYQELEGLLLAGIPTWIMARIERRRLASYGIPLRNAFGRDFWVGIAWGLGATSAVVGSIAVFGGYRILGLAIHGDELWYFTGLWIVANLLLGFSEEIQFRAYLLSTLAEGIGFWVAASVISLGFGALHYFLKPYERWEDFVSTALLSFFLCLTLRRTGSLAFAIGFHAAFDFANLFVWSGQNAGQFAIGRLLDTRWQGPQWLTGGPLGPEASWTVFPVIALMFGIFNRTYKDTKFPSIRTRGERPESDPR